RFRRRARQQGREQLVEAHALGIDLVDVARAVSVEKVGTQADTRDARGILDCDHAVGGDAIPIGYRRLRQAYSSGQVGNAACRLNGFVESAIAHLLTSRLRLRALRALLSCSERLKTSLGSRKWSMDTDSPRL